MAGKPAAMAPPPLIPPRTARLERSAGDPRPLSAISPRKVPRLHTARGAPPGASYREMTYNLHNLPWGDEVEASGHSLQSAGRAGSQTDRSWLTYSPMKPWTPAPGTSESGKRGAGR